MFFQWVSTQKSGTTDDSTNRRKMRIQSTHTNRSPLCTNTSRRMRFCQMENPTRRRTNYSFPQTLAYKYHYFTNTPHCFGMETMAVGHFRQHSKWHQNSPPTPFQSMAALPSKIPQKYISEIEAATAIRNSSRTQQRSIYHGILQFEQTVLTMKNWKSSIIGDNIFTSQQYQNCSMRLAKS